MTDRAFVDQLVQIGLETASGTPVDATHRLQSLMFEPQVNANINTYRATGYLFPTVAAEGREWTQANVSGPATYTELTHVFSSLFDTVGTASTVGTQVAYDWTFEITPTGGDTPVTFTVEQGSSVRAHEWSYGMMVSGGIEITRDEVNLIDGVMLGQRLTDDSTLTAAGTAVYPQVPILPSQVQVRIGDTQAGVAGEDALTRVFGVSWSVTDRWAPIWAINSDNTSFAAHVTNIPSSTVNLLLEADATGMGLLTTMRAGDTKFLHILATGPAVSGTANYEMETTIACKVLQPDPWSDEEGIYAINWPMEITYDATWGKSIQVRLRNGFSTLTAT